ncbi:MAG: molybdenum cofactor guanylyltransferase MobA [Betaproteobacteria bacterium]|nr:molybdenum cofactor guanylyltransferase MobA [Betaproteobacteria bacterium]
MIAPCAITGLVLAGGRGQRMGGADKGLQPFRGTPLALHALQRLAPQVGRVMINANRNLDSYAGFGVPVWPDAPVAAPATDAPVEFAGPLAGFIAGLQHCDTPYLVTMPCDVPLFPHDLVARLAAALQAAGADAASVATGAQLQPVFCLMRAALRDSLQRYLQGGGRKVDAWLAQQHAVVVPFDDEAAFANVNTQAELQSLEHRLR